MIVIGGWLVHVMIYPIFTAYTWVLIPSARAFDAYVLECCEHWEALRDAELVR